MNETGRNDHSSGREHDDRVLWIVIGFCLVVPVIPAYSLQTLLFWRPDWIMIIE